MAINKRLVSIAATLLIFVGLYADNGINSPYSRYGLGLLSDQNLAVNRQMGGLGYATFSNSYINLLNPAAIAHADTLTMLFEAGFSLQNVNFDEGGTKVNAHNAAFDYIAMQFRLRKGLGMSIGFLPYSNVGYSFGAKERLSYDNTQIEATSSYSGTGGIYQPFIGIGFSPIKDLSFGIMASYIYGDISHTISSTFSSANIDSRVRKYGIEVSNYKLDFGAQYTLPTGKNKSLTIGAVYSLGHDLNADATRIEQTGSNADTINVSNGFKLPHTIGAGAMYNINDNWKFGIDYTFQNWGDTDFFGDGNKGVNRSKISLGIEHSPNRISRNILKRMNYRIGAYYAQPYTQVNGKEGCEEYGASLGFSIPFTNKYRTSLLHISGQCIRMEPKSSGMIAETYLRINIGITFNETWFAKMKVY